jgi:hypothetical protein
MTETLGTKYPMRRPTTIDSRIHSGSNLSKSRNLDLGSWSTELNLELVAETLPLKDADVADSAGHLGTRLDDPSYFLRRDKET